MSEQETIFVDGLIFKSKHENAPDFVLGSISVKVDELTAFLQKHRSETGWVNIDFLRGKPKEGEAKGKPYFKLNTFKPEAKNEAPSVSVEDTISPDDASAIPF